MIDISKKGLEKRLLEIDKKKYSHLFLCLDRWDNQYYVEYISRDKNIEDAIKDFYKNHNGGMTRIDRIYNLDLNIEKQLNEDRPYHDEKSKEQLEREKCKKEKNPVEVLVKECDHTNYSHVIIKHNTLDNKYGAIYIKRGTTLKEIVNRLTEIEPLEEVIGIYNYSLNIDRQLKDKEPFFINNSLERIEDNIEERALEFATKKHKGQYRKSEDHKEYITHPINVANLIEKYKSDSKNISELKAAGYLHDVLENTDATFNELVDNFGIQVASLVDEVTSIKEFKNEVGKSKYLTIKMLHMSDWALVVKLCDRLDNISDLVGVTDEFRQKCINETIYILSNLLENRQLTRTQLNITTEIVKVMSSIAKYQMDEETNEQVNKIKKLIIEFEEK